MGRSRTVTTPKRPRKPPVREPFEPLLRDIAASWVPPSGLKMLDLDFQQDGLDVIMRIRLGDGDGERDATCRVRGYWLNGIPRRKLCPHVHLLLNTAVSHVIDPPGSFIPKQLVDRIRPNPEMVNRIHDQASVEG